MAKSGDAPPDDALIDKARQALYWRLLGNIFGQSEAAPNFDVIAKELVDRTALPAAILDPAISIDMLVQRHPALRADFEKPLPGFEPPVESEAEDEDEEDADAEAEAEAEAGAGAGADAGAGAERTLPQTVSRTLVVSKLLLNAFGPNTQGASVTASQYGQWTRDVEWFEKSLGLAPGSLRGRGGGQGGTGGQGAGTGAATRPPIGDDDLRAGLQSLEADMIHRMDLREVLKDRALAEKITPSMALIEQLLYDKGNLSGEALANAKRLIKKFVDELARVLKLQVRQAITKTKDSSVPPRRIFRNLDLKRTVWKNLTNWDPVKKKLYVDRLFYLSTAKKSLPTRLIILVDQSGSMTDAMVQSTILASIFAGLPNVEVRLFAYDTRVIDLTPYVHDPVETLLRTKLGGGTEMRVALDAAAPCIESPQNTAIVVISDYYDGSDFFSVLRQWKESGCHLIPVGSLQSTGYFSVSAEYRDKFKELGTPILNGSPKKLIEQIKKLL